MQQKLNSSIISIIFVTFTSPIMSCLFLGCGGWLDGPDEPDEVAIRYDLGKGPGFLSQSSISITNVEIVEKQQNGDVLNYLVLVDYTWRGSTTSTIEIAGKVFRVKYQLVNDSWEYDSAESEPD